MVRNTRTMVAGLLLAVLASGPAAAQPAPGSTLSAPLVPAGTEQVQTQTPASLGGPQLPMLNLLPPARFVPLAPATPAPTLPAQPAPTPPSQPALNPAPVPATTAPW